MSSVIASIPSSGTDIASIYQSELVQELTNEFIIHIQLINSELRAYKLCDSFITSVIDESTSSYLILVQKQKIRMIQQEINWFIDWFQLRIEDRFPLKTRIISSDYINELLVDMLTKIFAFETAEFDRKNSIILLREILNFLQYYDLYSLPLQTDIISFCGMPMNIRYFIDLLSAHSISVAARAAWILKKIALLGDDYRELCVQAGAIPALEELCEREEDSMCACGALSVIRIV